jgi:hypothetical protein
MTNSKPSGVRELDHPCHETCSGWKQGYDRGKAALERERNELIRRLEPSEPTYESALGEIDYLRDIEQSAGKMAKECSDLRQENARMREVKEYVLMFPDGSLHVCDLLEALLMHEAEIEYEILGYL